MPEAQGLRIVSAANEWIGTPFVWGASIRGVGCDCRGLLSGVARELGLAVAETFEATWNGYGRAVPTDILLGGLERLFDPAQEWIPGDILLIKLGDRAQHLAIYAGNGEMIHTYSRGPKQVVRVPMGRLWTRSVASAWRWRYDV